MIHRRKYNTYATDQLSRKRPTMLIYGTLRSSGLRYHQNSWGFWERQFGLLTPPRRKFP